MRSPLAVRALFLAAAAVVSNAPRAHADPYIGVFAGYGDASDAWSETTAPGDPTLSPEGIAAGGFVGFAHRYDALVLGGEVDVSFPDFSDDAECAPATDCALDVPVLSSLRGRAGVALGPVELYTTAGLALGV